MKLVPVTVGRTVLFFANGSNTEAARLVGDAELAAAIVTATQSDTQAHLHILLPSQTTAAFNVEHKSKAAKGEAYWDYPVIVKAETEEKTEPVANVEKPASKP